MYHHNVEPQFKYRLGKIFQTAVHIGMLEWTLECMQTHMCSNLVLILQLNLFISHVSNLQHHICSTEFPFDPPTEVLLVLYINSYVRLQYRCEF